MACMEITVENFEETVVKSEKTVLLDFWAPWCGPCKMLAPVVEKIAEENGDLILGKVNVDEQMPLAMRFGITSIPTLIVMREGRQVNKALGYMTREAVLKLLGK